MILKIKRSLFNIILSLYSISKFIIHVKSQNSTNVLSFGYFDGSLNDPLSIDGSKFSHIIYAFGSIDDNNQVKPYNQFEDIERDYHQSQKNCNCCLKGSYYQLFLLKQKYPHLKLILSIGGWGNSERFSLTFLTAQSRSTFIESITQWFYKYPFFEGLDIDWEYPISGGEEGTNHNENDGENLALFIKELRTYWNSIGHEDWYITLALPASLPSYLSENPNTMSIFAENLNWVLIMLYELAYGTSVTRHNSNWSPSIYDTAEAKYRCVYQCLESYLNKSTFQLSQLIIGIPMFSREYYEVRDDGSSIDFPGFNMPFNEDIPLGASGYNELMEKYLNNGFKDYYDPDAQASYLFNNDTHVYATYESRSGALPKINFIMEHGLGGLFYWELGRDSKLPQYSIVNYVNDIIKIDYSAIFNSSMENLILKTKKEERKKVIRENSICHQFTSKNPEFCNTDCEWGYETHLIMESFSISLNLNINYLLLQFTIIVIGFLIIS
ncbi:glycoside hydrolase [Anaeromyces robustus]|uniref:Glycoside hydrolase n=1 Tax=Anaeromyces robustus TaxID=1754192 RepID=A0A1Y1WQH9_9FUNG|nr:glycoside hydrolase [Anaeromyces robustus]|eukprot:ORX75732.1 glycoside hydrolase [Anaeromyces robustus]